MARRKTFKRRYQARRKKSILKNRFFWFSILFLIIFSEIFYLTCFYNFFQIKEIKISNLKKIEYSLIKGAIEKNIEKRIIFFDSKSIFLCNLKEINDLLLMKFPQISKIDLKRDFPNTITAKIEERRPVAYWSQNSDYFYIDKEGVIFDLVKGDIFDKSEKNKNLLFVKIKDLNNFVENIQLGEKVIEKERLNQILKIESVFKKEIKIQIETASIISERRLDVKLSEGYDVYFNIKKDIDWQLTELKFLLKEKITPDERKNLKYIDLRFEKVYVFPEI
ncbi:MAG: cell division protein FtsQ/DivIB [Patescibacteria group bacterium]|nr:cell division protein FtsQ/DivIB [Patescibacteria group bacterium]